MCRVPANNCSPITGWVSQRRIPSPSGVVAPRVATTPGLGPQGRWCGPPRSDLVGQHVQTVELGRLGDLGKRREGAVEHADAVRPPNEHLSPTVKRTPRISPFPGRFTTAQVVVLTTPKLPGFRDGSVLRQPTATYRPSVDTLRTAQPSHLTASADDGVWLYVRTCVPSATYRVSPVAVEVVAALPVGGRGRGRRCGPVPMPTKSVPGWHCHRRSRY